MKTLNIIVSCVAVAGIVALTGCQTPSQAKEAQAESDAAVAEAQAETAAVQAELDTAQAEAENQAQAASKIPGSTLTEDGTLLFSAEGQSVARADDGAEGVAKARMAAEAIAKANLLELLKGAQISSSITVGDMMFQSQVVTTKVNGWLAGAMLNTETSENKESNLPDAESVDQIVTAQASLELSLDSWEDLQDFVE